MDDNELLVITLNRDEMNLIVAGLSVGMANVADRISETDMMKKWSLPSSVVVRHIKKKSHTFIISRYTIRRWYIGVINGIGFLNLLGWEHLIQKMQDILYGDDETEMEV